MGNGLQPLSCRTSNRSSGPEIVVLWTFQWVRIVGVTLAVGLPLALVGVAVDRTGVLMAGYLLSLPFELWVGLLAAISFVLAVPRFLALFVGIAAFCVGLPCVCTWLFAAFETDKKPL